MITHDANPFAVDLITSHDILSVTHALITKQPLEKDLLKRMLNIPLSEEEQMERYLRSIQGTSCRVEYRVDRLRREKEAQVQRAIRSRENRKRQKKC